MTNAPTPPPGWYPDAGGWRWWDGHAWGPVAPAQQPVWPIDPVESGKTMSVLAHVGASFAAILLPLVLRLTEGDKNEYVRHHSTEALNFQITTAIVMFAGMLTFMITSIATLDDDGTGSGWAVVPFLALIPVFIASATLSIVGAVRAGQGRWWRYPISIRFVRGARREPPR